MVEREKEVWMVEVWSHGCEVSEYEVEDRQCLYIHPGQSPGFHQHYFVICSIRYFVRVVLITIHSNVKLHVELYAIS